MGGDSSRKVAALAFLNSISSDFNTTSPEKGETPAEPILIPQSSFSLKPYSQSTSLRDKAAIDFLNQISCSVESNISPIEKIEKSVWKSDEDISISRNSNYQKLQRKSLIKYFGLMLDWFLRRIEASVLVKYL